MRFSLVTRLASVAAVLSISLVPVRAWTGSDLIVGPISPLLTYDGNWELKQHVNVAIGASSIKYIVSEDHPSARDRAMKSTTTNSSVTFSFSGTGFTLTGVLNGTAGEAPMLEAVVDPGTDRETRLFRNNSTGSEIVTLFAFSNLTDGPHTASVTLRSGTTWILGLSLKRRNYDLQTP